MTTIAINSAADRVLLSARVKHFTGGPFLGRIRLYYNRIEFSGLTPTGRYRQQVLLSDVVGVDWFTDRTGEPNMVLLGASDAIGFWVKGAGIWRFKIQGLLSCKNDDERGILASDAREVVRRDKLSPAA